MPETLKERTAIDKQFTWDLSRLFADDASPNWTAWWPGWPPSPAG